MFCSLSCSGVYVCVEVDGYEFYDKQAQTHSSIHSLNPHWDQVRNTFFYKVIECILVSNKRL